MDRANRRYILTQGPLPNTVSHFWAMVWEQNSMAILMLNKLIEKKMVGCLSNIFQNPHSLWALCFVGQVPHVLAGAHGRRQ